VRFKMQKITEINALRIIMERLQIYSRTLKW